MNNRYSCYIVAFGLGFYILLHNDNGKDPADGSEDEYPFFNHIGTSLVKTFTMFVGELEFGDLPITSTVGYLFLLGNLNFLNCREQSKLIFLKDTFISLKLRKKFSTFVE